MGASFMTMSVKSTDRKVVEAAFAQAQAQDRYENGHEYSGGFGMASGLKFMHQVCEDAAAAETLIENTAEKWEAALAVQTKDGATVIGAWCAS